MSKDKIVTALVTKPTFINNVLHLPGELAQANLTDLGVDKLGDKTPGLEPYNAKEGEMIEQVQVAAIAPHAPNPENPQGIPPGSVISGTGRTLTPADVQSDDLAREMVAPEMKAPAKK